MIRPVEPWWYGHEENDDRAYGFSRGAAVAFGLMGMAEAIRARCARARFAAEAERFLDDHAELMRRLGNE